MCNLERVLITQAQEKERGVYVFMSEDSVGSFHKHGTIIQRPYINQIPDQ